MSHFTAEKNRNYHIPATTARDKNANTNKKRYFGIKKVNGAEQPHTALAKTRLARRRGH